MAPEYETVITELDNSPLSFSKTDPEIGLYVRSVQDGEESALVQRFLDLMIPEFGTQAGSVALFREPRLASGWPDIVIGVFDPSKYAEWTNARTQLEVLDLKVLQHLHMVGSTDIQRISYQLGLRTQEAETRLERLHHARLARQIRKRWVPYSLRRVFGVKRLIAIEAKISSWESAFRQAASNRWFASETYILFPVSKPKQRVLTRARQLGVGIYTCSDKDVTCIVPSEQTPIPLCYTSWLFNEWIGRSIHS